MGKWLFVIGSALFGAGCVQMAFGDWRASAIILCVAFLLLFSSILTGPAHVR
jgi:uncharacterized membrane protein YjjP (DUF1212 family)